MKGLCSAFERKKILETGQGGEEGRKGGREEGKEGGRKEGREGGRENIRSIETGEDPKYPVTAATN